MDCFFFLKYNFIYNMSLTRQKMHLKVKQYHLRYHCHNLPACVRAKRRDMNGHSHPRRLRDTVNNAELLLDTAVIKDDNG